VGNNQASLPLSDFDDLPAGSLGLQIASLDVQQVEQLIGYERNHAHRAQILEVLIRRRRQLHEESQTDPRRVTGSVARDRV
jgi:hypothetical protein